MEVVQATTKSVALAVESGGYPKLDNARSQIRLLRLLPASNFDAPLSVDLFVPDMTKCDAYEALSYCWGTELSEAKLTVNGAFELAMTVNLESALRHLRQPKTPRTLWIDAICINQQSIQERNQQVQLMNAVYSYAQSVVIWLGPTANDSDYVFEVLRTDMFKMFELFESPRFRRALYALCNRAWFGRVWIVQELALASQDPEMICAYEKISWHQFANWLDHVQIVLGSFHFGDGKAGQAMFSNEQYTDELTALERTELVAAIDHVLFLRDVRIETVENLNKSIKSNAAYPDLHAHLDSLQTNMHRTRFAQATNPRDKVFGLLGISAYPHPEVDYECEVRDLFVTAMFNTMKTKFQHGFPAFPLLSDEVRPADWPSWVPDFAASPDRCRAMKDLCPLDKKLEKLLDDAPWPKSEFPVAFAGARIMVTMGNEMGTVTKVVETLGWPELSVRDTILRLQNDLRPLQDALKASKPGAELAPSGILDAVGVHSKIFTHAPNSHEIASEWNVLWDNNGKVEREFNSWKEDYIHQILKATRTRCIVVTDTGKLAVCPKDAGVRAGDMIAGLFGLDFPMVVRPSGSVPNDIGLREGTEAFVLVSIAHVAEHKLGYSLDGKNNWREGSKAFAFV